MATVEDRPFRFDECLFTRLALVALRTFLGPTELADIALIDFALIWAVAIPAERTRCNQSYLFHLPPSTTWFSLSIIHQHG